MTGRHVAGLAMVGVLDRWPGITFRMIRMGMMGTGQIRERRPVISDRGRVKGTLCAWQIGMVMDAMLPLMPGGFVMFLAFKVCQLVLGFLCGGTNTTD